MERAPTKDVSASGGAQDRCAGRARMLAAVKFVGLSAPEPVEAQPPSFLARFRSLLFRA